MKRCMREAAADPLADSNTRYLAADRRDASDAGVARNEGIADPAIPIGSGLEYAMQRDQLRAGAHQGELASHLHLRGAAWRRGEVLAGDLRRAMEHDPAFWFIGVHCATIDTSLARQVRASPCAFRRIRLQ